MLNGLKAISILMNTKNSKYKTLNKISPNICKTVLKIREYFIREL